tara:strand:- start:32163 stop:32810 length:648 start_codon:yes stop_codon:yes gene_type:complete
MSRLVPSLFCLVLAAAAYGCTSKLDHFVCESNLDCESEQGAGICESDSLCSFADPICASGQRYGDGAGSESGRCTNGEGGGSSQFDAATVVGQADADPDAPDATPIDAGIPDASGLGPMTPDARPAILTLRAVIDGNNANFASLTFRVDGQLLGYCTESQSDQMQCNYFVESGKTVDVSHMGQISFVTGSCPSCNTPPCDFVITNSCDYVGIFNN